ncbi:Rop family plasmid primer RNA-binding protein [Escherichia coli]|uniref:Rop family plasmid primer RNA-binding protein n=1 Tax=Escherichia coli TaxID=562 RepID=UPI0023EAE30E|nr:Rop family plasmid primer RNA-binding protein [Escherichia coli]
MNKQQQAVLNMAGFIKSQSLTLLEKLDALDADEQAAMCEKLHELAEECHERCNSDPHPTPEIRSRG